MPYREKADQQAAMRRAYERRRADPARRAAMNAVANLRSRTHRRRLLEYKEHYGCARCGEKHPATLEFHHPDGFEKEFAVGAVATRSWARIMAEVQKCEVLCVNCHRKEHWPEWIAQRKRVREVL